MGDSKTQLPHRHPHPRVNFLCGVRLLSLSLSSEFFFWFGVQNTLGHDSLAYQTHYLSFSFFSFLFLSVSLFLFISVFLRFCCCCCDLPAESGGAQVGGGIFVGGRTNNISGFKFSFPIGEISFERL